MPPSKYSQAIWLKNFKKLRAFYRQHNNFFVPDDWGKDKTFPVWVENIRRHPEHLSGALRNALERIGFDFKDNPAWDEMFSRLQAFYRTHGHTNVFSNQRRYEKLFDWTVSQRQARSRMSSKRIKLLESLDFDWEIRSDKDFLWSEKYSQLVAFKKKYGHTKVPESFKENPHLAGWVSRQRSLKTAGKLTSERLDRLNQVGFLWKEDLEKLRHQAWQQRYEELVKYKMKNGHMDRLQIKKDQYQLGLWVETQITMQDKMLPDRKKKLNAIGFNWDKGDINGEKWQNMYERLKAYRKKYGTVRIKAAIDYPLAVWLTRQKQFKYRLSHARQEMLEKLGVRWSGILFNEIWQSRYEELKAFKEKHGSLAVPRSNKQLYEWIQTQRGFSVEGCLSAERARLLDKLGFIWRGETEAQRRSAWEVMFNRFVAHKKRYGARYMLELREDQQLHHWVVRQSHNMDKLSAYKVKKLDAIDFPWHRRTLYRDQQWEIMFEKLKAYKRKHGHCDVPQKDQQLGHWVNQQRNKKLPAEKIEKLSKLGFSWSGQVKEKRWHARVAEFKEMKRKGRKIAFGTPLYSWLYQQRKNFDRLPKEKKQILIKLGIGKKAFVAST